MLINMDFQSFPQRVSEVFVCDASLQMTCLLSMHKCSNLHIYPRTYAHTRAHTCRHIHMQRPGGALRALAVLRKPSINIPTHIHTNIHIHMQLPGGALRALAVLRQPSINTPTHIRTHTPSHAASRRGSPCPCSAVQAKHKHAHTHTHTYTFTCSVQEGLSVPLQCCASQAARASSCTVLLLL